MNLKELREIVFAMAEGYASKIFTPEEDDQFDKPMLLVENPKYDETNGQNMYLVLDLKEFEEFCSDLSLHLL